MPLTTRVALPALLALLSLSAAQAGELEAFTEPIQSIEVAAIESGIVIEMHVKEGVKVKRGQPLADLNQDVLKAALEIARAQRDSNSALISAESEFKLRSDRLAKLKQLRERGVASEEEIFRAALESEVAGAHVLAAKESLEIKTLEHERIRLQLAQRTVRSPLDGVVTQVFREVGEFVSPSDPVLMTVVQLDPLMVTFPVPASQAFKLKTGQALPIRIDGESKTVEGKIEFVSPVVNAESQTVRVRLHIANPNLKYRSGAKSYLDLPGGTPNAKPTISNAPAKPAPKVSSLPGETARQ